MEQKYRIMLVDDHASTREAMSHVLNRQPDLIVAGEAGSGEECLNCLDHINPDLVVMDILLPVMNGIETTKKLKANHPHLPVMVLSNYTGRTLIKAVRDAGASGYLGKDRAYEALIPAIRKIRDGESSFPPDIFA